MSLLDGLQCEHCHAPHQWLELHVETGHRKHGTVREMYCLNCGESTEYAPGDIIKEGAVVDNAEVNVDL